MIRSVRIALAAAAATTVALAATVPAIAAAPGPKGTLTVTEYKQLLSEQAAFKKLKHTRHLTWNDFYAVCHQVGQSTPLMQSIRANCETGVGIDQSLVGFYSDAARCSALSTGTTTTTTPTGTTTTGTTTTGTTTTGTTTTGTGTTTTGTTTTGTGTSGTGTTGTTPTPAGTLSPTDLKLFACLQPEYAVISRAVKSIYRSQTALRRQVLARDFVGRCELTLAPTKLQLSDLERWTVTAKQVAADVSLISQVAGGQQPASALNSAQVVKDTRAFSDTAKAFEHIRRPQVLSVCPHQ
jgi:hypothetical protein